MSTSSRVIKNTIYLYIKMGVNVFISLYTTRLILASLGASDFGIFNIVGGAIAMMGFLNSTMANATQRFMSYAEGEGILEKKKQVFNVSFVLHIAIAIVTLVLLLIVMIPLFNGILNIEPSRVSAAKIVYLCLIVSTMFTIINVPYDAIMNAHENMLYYSIVGIFESCLRLAVAFACVYTSKDKLIVYGILMAVVPLISVLIMKVYCHKHYKECVIAPRKHWDKSLVSKIASFTGWNFLTAISSLLSAQGIGLVLNHFYGTVLNAAQGVANQLNGYLSAFSGNMMKALNPVIVKSAGSHSITTFNKSTLVGCKYSTYLTLLFAVPCIVEMPYILTLWLKEVPEWTSTFCIMQLIQTIIIQFASSAATAIYAQGYIKHYAVWKSIMNILPVILTYVAFRLGGNPYWLYIPMLVFFALGGNMVIIYYASRLCGLSTKQYLKMVVVPIIICAFLMFIVGGFMKTVVATDLCGLVVVCFATTIMLILSIVTFGSTKEEKYLLLSYLKNVL